MQNTQLQNIQNYCKDKTIIIVGNSSTLLNSEMGKFIDSHNIVVRMNYALPIKPSYLNNIGRRTDIYMAGISRARIIESLVSKDCPKFILRLTPWSEPINLSNVYYNTREEYSVLKKSFGDYKPSSGCLVIDFFKKNIDYKLLNIVGFDFFEKADRFKKNEFKSYLYKDHDILMEKKYILKCLDNKTKIIKS